MLTNFARLSRRIVALVALERFISSVIMLVSFQIKNLSAWKITMITLERLFFGMGHQLMWLNRVVRQNANWIKCQPDTMPTGLFVRPNFSFAFCPEHLNMFWPFVRIIRLVWWVLMTSHTCPFISDPDFSGKRRGVRTEVCTGCLKKLSFTDLSISRLDWPLRAARPWKLTFLLVISY